VEALLMLYLRKDPKNRQIRLDDQYLKLSDVRDIVRKFPIMVECSETKEDITSKVMPACIESAELASDKIPCKKKLFEIIKAGGFCSYISMIEKREVKNGRRD
jgi:hypothetical protein